MMINRRLILTVLAGGLLAGGCTVHPAGESHERQAALAAGQRYKIPIERRPIPPLPDHPSPDDLIRYALKTNADVERTYWQWRSAIEQIPQDGTPQTTLAINAATSIVRGRTDWSNTVLTAQNMPSMMIPWPGKLSTAAQRALENARAAGLRFRKAQFDVRAKVRVAWDAYALNAELIRLEEANAQLLQTTVRVVEARNRAGAGGQADTLKARIALQVSRNDLSAMQAQLPAQRAALNALMNRLPGAVIPVPANLPPIRSVKAADAELLALVEKQNPGLIADSHEITARRHAIELAKLQYDPDFAANVSTDLGGIVQSIAGMVSVPLLRYQAINAAIAQGQADLNAAQAQRRQAANDLDAQIVLDIRTLRDADQQLDLFDRSILPSQRQVVEVDRVAYQAGRLSLADLLEDQRFSIVLQRWIARLRVTRDQRVADLESITACDLTTWTPPNDAGARVTLRNRDK